MGQTKNLPDELHLVMPRSYDWISDKAKDYGEIGLVIASVSAVEHRLDEFIFNFHNHPDTPKWKRRFPLYFKQKIGFLEKAVGSWSSCQSVPVFFDSPEVNVGWVCLHLKSLASIRNTLAHGANYSHEVHENSKTWKLTRFQKHSDKSRTGTWVETTTTVGDKVLAGAVHTASIVKIYLRNLSRSVVENIDWEKEIEEEKQMVANRKLIGELNRSGKFADDPWLSQMFGEPER